MSNISIETTQNITIEYKAANVVERAAAAIIDLIILLVGLISYSIFATILTGIFSSASEALLIIFSVTGILIFLFYFPLCEVLLDGQTLGKRALKIRVVKLDGSPASIGAYIIRWVVGIFELLTLFGSVAFLSVLLLSLIHI